MYQVICFSVVDKSPTVKRYWIKEDKQVCQLVYNGYIVFRAATDQLAVLQDGEVLMWKDIGIEDAQNK